MEIIMPRLQQPLVIASPSTDTAWPRLLTPLCGIACLSLWWPALLDGYFQTRCDGKDHGLLIRTTHHVMTSEVGIPLPSEPWLVAANVAWAEQHP